MCGEELKIEQVYLERLQPTEWAQARERKNCEDEGVADWSSTCHSPPPCSVLVGGIKESGIDQ